MRIYVYKKDEKGKWKLSNLMYGDYIDINYGSWSKCITVGKEFFHYERIKVHPFLNRIKVYAEYY